MNERTLQALKKTIRARWYLIAFKDKCQSSVPGCALCSVHPDCIGCPVAIRVNDTGCYSTPYWDFIDAEDADLKKGYAVAEFHFLISLLPNGEAVILEDGDLIYNNKGIVQC